MKPAVYPWKFMMRDYFRLLVDDTWMWCRHCRRPVEHAMAAPDGHPGPKVPVCMDCGMADRESLRTHPRHRSASDY